jgi:hypothetical protein
MNDEDILQACIDDVLAGRKTPGECVALYPQFPDLRAYLNAAVVLQATQSLSLSPDVEQRIEARLRQRVSELSIAPSPVARPSRRPVGLRWVVAPGLAVSLLLAGIGTTAAAGSNPGDLLYGVKRAEETAQVFLSPDSARASAYAGLARHRLDEMTVVLQRGNPDASTVNKLSGDLTEQTSAALAFVDDAPAERQADILNNLVQMTSEQQAVLASVQQVAPPEAQEGLKRALQASGAGHARAVERLEQVLASQKPKNSPTPGTATSSATATPAANQPDDETHVPPGQTQVPPGQTHVPPGQTRVPPGQTHVPPGQSQEPPGQSQQPPGQTNVPPGQTRVPPGQDMTPQPTRHASGHGP